MINNLMLKAKAQEIIRTSKPKIIRVALVYVAITTIFGLLSTYLMGGGLSEKDLLQITKHIENGNMEYAIRYMEDYMPSAGSQGVRLLIDIVMNIVSVGFVIFLLNSIRRTEPCYGNLLDGFGMPLRIVLLNILTGIFVFLWSLLLFVPGIMAAYSYRMSTYLLIDHPEYSPMDCLRESKKMMKGHRAELFWLDLSFIGWALLSSFPGIGWIVSIWTTPYFATTYALFYENLSGGERIYNDTEYSYGGSEGHNGNDSRWM